MSDTTFFNGCGHLIANRCILRSTIINVERIEGVCKHCHEEYLQKEKETQAVFNGMDDERNSTE